MNEIRLIDANALKKVLQNREECKECTDIDCIHCFYDIIDNAPTVEPHYVLDLRDDIVKTLQTLAIDYSDGIAIFERKRQGEWEKIGKIGLAYKCDRCGEVIVMPTNFCPNCGAKMKGGAE